MSLQRVLLIGSCSFCVAATVFAGSVPVVVSPGDAARVALIADPCPTFSWGAVSDADSYELVVYQVGENGKAAESVLMETFAGSVYSWTPSLDRCLERSGRYAWSVRAMVRDEASDWSRPSLFEVASGPTPAELEEAMAMVRSYLEEKGHPADRPPRADTGVGAAPWARSPEGSTAAAEADRQLSTLSASEPPALEAPAVVSIVTEGAIGVGTSAPLADLHVVGSPTLGSLVLAPDEPEVNQSSELVLAEDDDGGWGMKIKYDGVGNNLEFWGFTPFEERGPWLTIQRDTGVQGHIYLQKSDIETVTASTTLQADDDLFFGIGADELWTFEALLWVSTSTASGDISFVWRGPGGSDVRSNVVAYQGNTVVKQANQLMMNTVVDIDYSASVSIQPIYLKGLFWGGDGGSVRLEWAQRTASGTTDVYWPSYLEARRVQIDSFYP